MTYRKQNPALAAVVGRCIFGLTASAAIACAFASNAQALARSCDDLFGSSSAYELCNETATTCEFYSESHASCDSICGGAGESCLDAHDNESGYTCVEEAGNTCGGGTCACGSYMGNGICTCSKSNSCTSDCSGKECGDDGCGGWCGSCGVGETCDASQQCVVSSISCDALFGGTSGYELCTETASSCQFYTNVGSTCDALCNGAGEGCLAAHDNESGYTCMEEAGNSCGGGACTCSSFMGDGLCTCSKSGVCTPDCSGKECGDDGCGGSCGSCSGGKTCDAGTCVASGGGSGSCDTLFGGGSAYELCNETATTCEFYSESHASCDSICGGAGESCLDAHDNESGYTCVEEAGNTCGGGTCTCGSYMGNGICTCSKSSSCTSDCSGKECGDDGCGGWCGSCGVGETCDASQQCVVSSISCDALFGGTSGYELCTETASSCQFYTNVGSTCDALCNGAGEGCLAAHDNESGYTCMEEAGNSCGGGACTCSSFMGDGLCTCSKSGVCTPDCSGKECGDDDCGGSCGTCADGESCGASQQCVPVSGETMLHPDAPFYQPASSFGVHSESADIIAYLTANQSQAWPRFRIDYAAKVLRLSSSSAKIVRTYEKRVCSAYPDLQNCPDYGDWFEDTSDYTAVPVPQIGSIQGYPDYTCPGLGELDCHLIVFDEDAGMLYEIWRADIRDGAYNVNPASGGMYDSLHFIGGAQSNWDRSINYWADTRVGAFGRGHMCIGADAAGLPMAPLLPTTAEVEAAIDAGNISLNHALRITWRNSHTRPQTYAYPATSVNGSVSGGANSPPYGTHLRLKETAHVNGIIATLRPAAQVIARTLQTYGAYHADGGNAIDLMVSGSQHDAIKWFDEACLNNCNGVDLGGWADCGEYCSVNDPNRLLGVEDLENGAHEPLFFPNDFEVVDHRFYHSWDVPLPEHDGCRVNIE